MSEEVRVVSIVFRENEWLVEVAATRDLSSLRAKVRGLERKWIAASENQREEMRSEHSLRLMTSRKLMPEEWQDPLTYWRRRLRTAEESEDRLRTIVMALLRTHADFLRSPAEDPPPLRMEDLANEVGVHVSVISRTAKNVVIDAPSGRVRLRSMFSGAVPTADPAKKPQSKATLREHIEEILQADQKRTLSDEAVRQELLQRGFKIARRTVAKYRKDLGFDSTR